MKTLKDEIRYLRNKNIRKTYIITSSTENQTKGHVKATTKPNVHQYDTAIQTEKTPTTGPQEEITPQNSHDTVGSIPGWR